jgi:hypothetical protein
VAAGTVPLVVVAARPDPFVLPKLAVLWAVLGICSVLAAGGVGIGGAAGLELRVRPHLDLAIVSFLILGGAAAIASIDPMQSLIGERGQYQGLLTTFMYVAFFFVARLSVTTDARARLLLTAVSSGASLVAVYAIAQRLGVDPVWGGDEEVRRVFSSTGQPNALASYLVVAMPAALVLAREFSGIGRLAALGAVGTIVGAVLLTESRGGYLGLLLTGFLMSVLWGCRPVGRGRAGVAAVSAVTVVILTMVTFTPARTVVTDSWDRFASIADLGDDLSILNHWDTWKVAAHVAVDHPLTGTGPETFPDVFPEYSHDVLPEDRASYFDSYRVESPHNFVLAIAAGSGMLSLVAFSWTVGAVLLVAIAAGRTRPESAFLSRAVIVSMAGYASTNLFITADLSSTWSIWVLMGAAIGLADAPATPTAEAGLPGHRVDDRERSSDRLSSGRDRIDGQVC